MPENYDTNAEEEIEKNIPVFNIDGIGIIDIFIKKENWQRFWCKVNNKNLSGALEQIKKERITFKLSIRVEPRKSKFSSLAGIWLVDFFVARENQVIKKFG